ncbi:MAG: BMP family ABC transporter substrate-binding protein [Actinobacteria bacterium]|nr:BMP family ABC transporter substrate-binding protein [Actinomycetota bacterium]
MIKWLRWIAVLAIVAMVAAACNGDNGTGDGTTTAPPTTTEAGTTEPPPEPTTVGLVYDIGGRGDLSFNDSAAAGHDQATQDFGIEPQELEPNQGGTNREELMRLLADQGTDLIIGVGFLFSETVCKVAQDYPEVNFADVDGFIDATTCEGGSDLTEDSNIASLLFAEHQGSFLVGAAAAMKSTTGHIGFIGGVEIGLIQKFEAGFAAGARHVDPDITIDVQYISQPPDFSGFNDPAKGKEIAAGMYDGGADVVYHAAGGSGAGLFEAAKEASDAAGEQRWAIGVDSDQYQSAPPELQPYILTSMLKRVDVSVYESIAAQVDGNFVGGYLIFDLARDGVGYSTSGGFVDDIVPDLEELKAAIISGEIEVPDAV